VSVQAAKSITSFQVYYLTLAAFQNLKHAMLKHVNTLPSRVGVPKIGRYHCPLRSASGDAGFS